MLDTLLLGACALFTLFPTSSRHLKPQHLEPNLEPSQPHHSRIHGHQKNGSSHSQLLISRSQPLPSRDLFSRPHLLLSGSRPHYQSRPQYRSRPHYKSRHPVNSQGTRQNDRRDHQKCLQIYAP
ncbi:hypothetical protein B0T25DRAFT_528878 [Lasiosphaeria hispida]|uniref:Secreted protein n=1 Tax=Lasiosphaeria hispida TaxID=260671 RepID=A0AAJ0HWN6_9PEZI|nr:hypothetical protein B0T25DRAFT_528878 [Lasiosphaeria hispida]